MMIKIKKPTVFIGGLLVGALSFSGISLGADKSKKEEEKAKPKISRTTYRNVDFSQKKKAQYIRAETLRNIRELLKTTKDDSRRYELMRRYGEMYVEQAEYALDKEIMIYERAYNKWLRKKKKGKEPELSSKTSTFSLQKAVKVYKHIVAKYPKYPGVDISYYELGKGLLRLNDKSGVKYLLQLTKEHPNSIYIPEAYITLGDHYFESHEMVKAKGYYQKSAKFKSHAIYPYAIYRLGWTYYNYPSSNEKEEAAKFKKAITAFKLVVRLADVAKAKSKDKAVRLRQEAINDLIMVWAETENVESAWAYFKKIGDKESFYKMLERLGFIYVDQGKYPDAIKVYSRLLKERPNRDTSPTNHRKLVDIYQETSKAKLVVKQSRAMTKLYLKGGSWYKAHARQKDKIADARGIVEINLHRWSTSYHQAAQKAKKINQYKIAAALYSVYLKNFPKEPKAYELRFYFADTLLELDKYELAAKQYTLVVKANPKGKHLHDAAMNAVIAMRAVVERKKFSRLPKIGTVKKPLAIPKAKLRLVTMLDQYLKYFPKKKDSNIMAYSAGTIFHEHGHYDKSIARFHKLALTRKGSPESKKSAEAVLGYYNLNKDWNGVIKYTKIYLAAKGLLDKKLLASTQKLLVYASFERALDFDKAKKHKEAATAFLAFQKDFPKEKLAPTATFNAMLIYFKLGLVNDAFAAARIVLKNYPRYEKRSDTIALISEAYEGLGDFANAAKFYSLFAKSWPKDKRTPKFLFSSAVLYSGIKKYDSAEIAYLGFIKRYPKSTYQLGAHMDLAKLYDDNKQPEKALALYRTIFKNFKKSANDNAYARVKINLIMGAKLKPASHFKNLLVLQKWLASKGSPSAFKARDLVAEALFLANEEKFEIFAENQIKNDKLEKNITAMQQQLVALAGQYEKIIAIGYPDHTVASTYRLGQAHEAFAKALLAIKAPATFDAQGVQDLKKQLKQFADPLTKEALKFYRASYSRANKLGVFTSWAIKAYSKMSELDPKAHPVVKEFSVEPGYASHSISYDKSVATVLH